MKHRTGLILPLVTALLTFYAMPANTVPLESTGVGVENRMENSSYSLKLVFFEKGGPYVANVQVKIRDRLGNEIVNQISAGPWLYVDLEQGDYFVEATRQDGQLQGAQIHIGETQTETALMFDFLVQ